MASSATLARHRQILDFVYQDRPNRLTQCESTPSQPVFTFLIVYHQLYTTSYDCTVRQFSFVSGISHQIYSSSDVLITSLEMVPSGHEMWISDVSGGVTRLDLREGPSHARWYGLSDQKIGSVSINPTNPHLILTASNNRSLK